MSLNSTASYDLRRLVFPKQDNDDRPFLSSREPTPLWYSRGKRRRASIFRTLKDSLGTRRATSAERGRESSRIRTWKNRGRTFYIYRRPWNENNQCHTHDLEAEGRKTSLFLLATRIEKYTRPSSRQDGNVELFPVAHVDRFPSLM